MNKRKENLIQDTHAIRQGPLKRIKSTINTTRYVGLFKFSDRGEARIEFYDEKNVAKARKVYLLIDVVSVSGKADASKRHEHAFVIHLRSEVIVLACASREEKMGWLLDIATLPPRGVDGRHAPDFDFIHAWRVTILPEGLHGVFHFQRCEFIFILNEFTIELVDPDDHEMRWTWRLGCIRNCGFDGSNFLFEPGRSSFSGHGTMWLRMASKEVAKEVHQIILVQMSRDRRPSPETEANLQLLQKIQKDRLFHIEARYGPHRSRGLSAPGPLVPSGHPVDQNRYHRSRSQCIRSKRDDSLAPSSASLQPGARQYRPQMSVPAPVPTGNRDDTFQRYNSDPGRPPRSLEENLQFTPSPPTEPPPEDIEEYEEMTMVEEEGPRHCHHQRSDSGFVATPGLSSSSYVDMTPVNPSVLQSFERMSLEMMDPRRGVVNERGFSPDRLPVVKAATRGQRGFADYELMQPRRLNSRDAYEDMTLGQGISTPIYENHQIKTQ